MPRLRYNRYMPRAKADHIVPEDLDAVTDAVLAVSRALVAISVHSVAAVDDSLTLPQFRLLVVLSGNGPLKLSAVADTLGVNPSTVTRMVDRLIASEMVDRRRNPASKREQVVALTDTGAEVVQQILDRRRREVARIVKKMPPAARQDLIRALTNFAETAGELPVARSPYDATDS